MFLIFEEVESGLGDLESVRDRGLVPDVASPSCPGLVVVDTLGNRAMVFEAQGSLLK